MKSVILSILFLVLLQTSSFAQKYEYSIIGEFFSDTVYDNEVSIIHTKNSVLDTERKAVFDIPVDTTYTYHLVGAGENAGYILNLYQICAPCFAKWNNFELEYSNYSGFNSFKDQPLYEGEYLKVALKEEYEKGMSATFKTGVLQQIYAEQAYLGNIARQYEVAYADLCLWNNLDPYAYYVEKTWLIVGKIEYKYACPCVE